MLVNATNMLLKARDGHYAVGQFNINNLEWTKSILLTAQEMNSPVILGVSEGARAALAAAFLNEFWALYHGVPKPEYLPEYRARQALLGQTVTVTPRNGTPRKAEALDIDEDCRLVVRFAGEHNSVPLRGEEVHLGKYL